MNMESFPEVSFILSYIDGSVNIFWLGMGDGAITLWDVRKILDNSAAGNNAGEQPLKLGRGCVSAANIHNGVPVNTIEFNPHKKNLLASGGSEVLI